jgi:hypothetical protein
MVSASGLAGTLQAYPFKEQLTSLPTHCIGFCDVMSAEQCSALMAFDSHTDHFAVGDGIVYWASSNRQSEPTFTIKQLEKAIGTRVTFRGYNTISRLCAKISAMGEPI